MRESDDVKPTSEEVVAKKLEEIGLSIELCENLVKEVKRLVGVVLSRERGYISR